MLLKKAEVADNNERDEQQLPEEISRVATVYTSAAELAAIPLVRTDKGYCFLPFAAKRGDKLMQPYLFTARRGEVRRHRLTHEGDEFVYMLDGELKYRVGDVEYTLRPGDSLYFDAGEEHEVRPLSGEIRYVAIFASRREVQTAVQR